MRTLTCPRCRKPWEVDALHAGMKAVCPNCHASIAISAGPAASKTAPLSAGAANAAPAITATAAATAKPTAVNEHESVVPKASSGAILTAAQTAPTNASVVPPPVMPSVPLPTILNGSSAPAPAKPASEVTAQTKNEPTEAQADDDGRILRRPLVLAAVVLLLVAGGVIAIWRPWDPRPEQSVVGLPSNKGLPNQEVNSAATAPLTASTPTDELPPIEPVLPQAISSASKPAPKVKLPTPPAPAIKPSSTTPPPPTVERRPNAPAPPTSTPPVIRKPAPPPTYNRSPLEPGAEGTQPLTPQTPLKAGDHLHGQYEGRWYAVTVVETLDDGNIRVRWDTWGKDVIGSIPRVRLRLPAKK